jgi:toxin ParE1/3/4
VSYRIEWSEAAVEDAARILEYLAARGQLRAAEKLLAGFKRRVASLAAMPERGRIVPELRREGIAKYRELVDLAPYRIVYALEGRAVYVHVIVDGRQELDGLLHDRLVRGQKPALAR